MADRLRSFDTEKVKRSLKTYVDVIGAMRDIFGDLGRPDAPMQELVQALETMTQGGLAQLDAGSLNMMVRRTNEVAKLGGMSLDSAMAMQQHAAGRAQQLGISPLHAVEATQGGMAWGSAYRASGGAAVTAWGRNNADQMMQADTNLRVAAAASEQANRLAAIMRLRENIGGRFQADSELEAAAQAIQAGQTEYTFGGKTKSLLMTGNEFSGLMTGARNAAGESLGVTSTDVMMMMAHPEVLGEQIQRYNLGDIARRTQPQEARQWMAQRTVENISDRLRRAGMDAAKAQRIGEQVGANVANRMASMSNAEFADGRTRTDIMARTIESELAGTEARAFLGAQGLNNRDYYRTTAGSLYDYMDMRRAADPRMRGFGSIQNMQALMSEEMLNAGSKVMTQANFNAQMADALTPLGRGSMLRRGVQALQDADKNSDPLEIIGKALGGVSRRDIDDKLRAPMQQVAADQQRLKELHQQYASSETSEQRQRVLALIEEQQQSLRVNAAKLASVGEKFGFGPDMITQDDVEKARESWERMTVGMRDTVGLAGAFGWKVTEKERSLLRAGGTLDSAQAKALIPDEGARREMAAELFIRREGERAAKETSKEAIAEFYKANRLQFASEAEAGKALREANRRNRMAQVREEGVTEAQVDAVLKSKIQASEIDDVALMGRASIPTSPTDTRIEEIRTQYSTEDRPVTQAEARLLGEAELRARRMGIDEDTIKEAVKGIDASTTKNDAETRLKAIGVAIEQRFAEQLDPSKIDLAKMSEDELKRINEQVKRTGKETVTDEDRRNFIMAERQREQKTKMRDFWFSESGAMFREQVNEAMTAADDLGQRFITSKTMINRLGPQGLRDYQALMGQQQEIQSLAMRYAGGDVARLMMGDLDIGWSTENERKKYQTVRGRVEQLRAGIAASEQGLARGFGEEGRQWGMTQGEAESAAWRLMEFNFKGRAGVSGDVLKLAERDFDTLSAAERKKLVGALSDQERQDYQNMVAGVSTLQKMSDTSVGSLQDYQEAKDRVQAVAKSLGVTDEEVLRAGRGRDLGFGVDEEKRVRVDKARYEKAQKQITDAQAEIVRLEREKIGKTGQERDKIEEQIAAQKSNIAMARGTIVDVNRAQAGRAAELGYGSIAGMFSRMDEAAVPSAGRLKAFTKEQEDDVKSVARLYSAYQGALKDKSGTEVEQQKRIEQAKKDYEAQIAKPELQQLARERGFVDEAGNVKMDEFMAAAEKNQLGFRDVLTAVTGVTELHDTQRRAAENALKTLGVPLEEAVKGLTPLQKIGKIADRMAAREALQGEALGEEVLKAYGVDPGTNKEALSRMSGYLQDRPTIQSMKMAIGGAEFLGMYAEKSKSRGAGLVSMADAYEKIAGDRELSDKERDKQFAKFRKQFGVGESEWGVFQRHMRHQLDTGMIAALRENPEDVMGALEKGTAVMHMGGQAGAEAQQRMDVTIRGNLTIHGNGTGDVDAHGPGQRAAGVP